MDIKRREFMKGMVSASLVGGVLIMPGGYYLLQHKTETEQPPQTPEHNAFQLNYDFAQFLLQEWQQLVLFSTTSSIFTP